MNAPLLDRPLHRDPLVRIAGVVVLVAAVLSAADNIKGPRFDPERAAAFLSVVVVTVVATALVVLAAAVVRRWRRHGFHWSAGRTPAWRATSGQAGGVLGCSGTCRGCGHRGGVDPSAWAPCRLSHNRPCPDSDAWSTSTPREKPTSSAVPVRPPALSVTVDNHVTVVGVPVEVFWRAPGAEWVRVGYGERVETAGRSAGSTSVHLAGSADIVITAGNAAGASTARTGLVRVLQIPAINAVRVPQMPPVPLATALPRNGQGSSSLQRLDRVLAAQAGLRRAHQPAPLHIPPAEALQMAVSSLTRTVQRLRSRRRAPVARVIGGLPQGSAHGVAATSDAARTGSAS